MGESSVLPDVMLLPKRKLLEKSTSLPGGAPHTERVEHDGALCATYLAAMDVLAKPWNGLIIAVLEVGPLRFSELSSRLPAIGDRMLAARLKELGVAGLVARRVEGGPPVRVSYELTEVGRGFRDVADAIRRWGQTIITAQQQATAPKRAARLRRSG
jgi:DNA-binding HxlR family transcriptional regulator